MRLLDDSPAPGGRGAAALAGAGTALAMLRVAAVRAVDLLYPPHCLACGRLTGRESGLCGPCWGATAFITRPFCEVLGTPFAQDLGPGLLSPEAIAHPPAFGRARAVALFDAGPARRLVHRLKYGDRPDVARLMGSLMAVAAAELCADRPALVPMPLHRTRLWRRQFNQAGLLADAMASRLDLAVDHGVLHRVRATAHQTGLTRLQRADNVQGAFAVPPGAAVAGRAFLLVDDVLTTGSTADAAARALLRKGARRVDLAVFARVAAGGSAAILG